MIAHSLLGWLLVSSRSHFSVFVFIALFLPPVLVVSGCSLSGKGATHGGKISKAMRVAAVFALLEQPTTDVGVVARLSDVDVTTFGDRVVVIANINSLVATTSTPLHLLLPCFLRAGAELTTLQRSFVECVLGVL